jgi:serine/threonine protein kinase/Flp pilus assembly protein TadD
VEGRRIAHFELLNELGAGGMGVVYRARDLVLHRDVALKIIQPDKATAEFRRRFLEEARIAATLAHPGIAAVYEAGEVDRGPSEEPEIYAAQELVEGETLAEMLARGPLPIERATGLVLQLLDALAHAHARAVVHRDIKPGNLMVASGDRLKVLDFGIAKRLASPAQTTAPLSTVVGTPAYMAPEQLRGFADQRTDIFATGCVLYEALTGGPWVGRPGVTSHVPASLAPILERATTLDPAGRFPDADAFATAIREASAERASSRRRQRRTAVRLARPIAAAVVSLVILLLTYAAWHWSQPALAFSERDLVLIAGVVNETGDAVFDSAIEAALEADLQQSRYVNVFDQAQRSNALQMMRLPPSHRIDTQTGRELCRIAGIRALLVPTIRSAGGAYLLDVNLIDPGSGRIVENIRVTAPGKQDVLLAGIDQLTRLVRERLGESIGSIQKTDPQLVEFATPSLEALRFVRLGGEALAAADVSRAARAFQQALEHDPKYAAALGSLGLLNIEFLNRPEEGRKQLTAALEHSSRTSEREHFMVRGLHKQFVENDPAGALEDYRFVSSLYPDMFQPHNNSGRILMALGKYREAVHMFERAHALDPRHAVPLWNLWDLRLNRLNDPAGAEQHARAVVALQPDNPWVRHMIAWTDVALRRFDEAEQGMRQVLSAVPLHPYAFANLGHLLMRRGAAEEAVSVYDDLLQKAGKGLVNISSGDAALVLGLALAAAGRDAEARRVQEEAAGTLARSAQGNTMAQARLSTLYAALGRRSAAERIIEELQRGHHPGVLYQLARTRAQLGDLEAAAGLLRQARVAGYDQPYFVLIDPVLSRLKDHPVIDELAVRPQ